MTSLPPTTEAEPAQARIAKKYLQALNEIQQLGMPGFSVLIDSATQEELDDLEVAADVILMNVARTKAIT